MWRPVSHRSPRTAQHNGPLLFPGFACRITQVRGGRQMEHWYGKRAFRYFSSADMRVLAES